MPVEVMRLENGVYMSMPVSGTAGDFDDERTAGNGILPVGAVPEFSEAGENGLQHVWEFR